MNGEQKMWSILGCAAAAAIIGIAVSVAYYSTAVETAAIQAGLVQQRIGNRIIWTKP